MMIGRQEKMRLNGGHSIQTVINCQNAYLAQNEVLRDEEAMKKRFGIGRGAIHHPDRPNHKI